MFRHTLLIGLPAGAIWWLLSGGVDPFFTLAAVGLAVATFNFCIRDTSGFIHPVAAVRFALYFIQYSLLGGIDVSRRALQRRPALAPQLVRYPLRLPPEAEAARLLFACTINLLPGTATVGLEREALQVHVLDGSMCGGLETCEAHIAALFGITLEAPS